MPKNKLFIGNLSWDTSEAGLRSAFERFGELSEVRIITDRETGRSRGFGFITFVDVDSATEAMNEMNGTEIDRRTIVVNEAQERRQNRDRPRRDNW